MLCPSGPWLPPTYLLVLRDAIPECLVLSILYLLGSSHPNLIYFLVGLFCLSPAQDCTNFVHSSVFPLSIVTGMDKVLIKYLLKEGQNE
jgi:hypothetical protein